MNVAAVKSKAERSERNMAFNDPMKRTIYIRNCAYGFSCTQNWDALEDTSEHAIKFCNTCHREVYWCNEQSDLANNVTLNRCVGYASSGFGKSHNHYPPPPKDDFNDDIPF
jgi:hypothetical protein